MIARASRAIAWALAVIAGMASAQDRFERICERADRTKARTLGCVYGGVAAYASPYTFEFASPSSTVMPAECTCPASIESDTGTALTFSRASAAQCLNSSNTYVQCADNQPVVETAGTWRGVRVETASTNLFLRSNELDNAAWTATAVVTPNAYTGPEGANMDQLDDDQAGTIEGVSQDVATTSSGFYYMSCWLRSGSHSVARMVFTGTGSAAGDTACNFNLTTTPGRYTCVSGSYAGTITSLNAFVGVGSAAASAGTIGAGSCQLERQGTISSLGGYNGVTSYIPTVAAQVTRAAVAFNFTVPAAIANAEGCMKLSTYWGSQGSAAPDWVYDQGGAQTVDNALVWGSLIARKTQFYDGTNATQTAAIDADLSDAWIQARGGWIASGSATEVSAQKASGTPVTATGTYDGAMSLASQTFRFGMNYAATRSCNCLIGPTIMHTSKTSCPLVTP